MIDQSPIGQAFHLLQIFNNGSIVRLATYLVVPGTDIK